MALIQRGSAVAESRPPKVWPMAEMRNETRTDAHLVKPPPRRPRRCYFVRVPGPQQPRLTLGGIVMLDRQVVTKELRELILGALVPLDEDELANDAPLVDEILDSLGIAEVATFIEERIARPLSPDEEVRATFASIDTVVDFIVANG